MKYKKENEEVILNSTLYPQNTIPKGYPNKIPDKKINETIYLLLDHLKKNGGSEIIVSKDVPFINLGLTELTNRQNKRQSKIAFWFSLISILLSILAITTSSLALKSNTKDYYIQQKQLNSIDTIKQIITENQTKE